MSRENSLNRNHLKKEHVISRTIVCLREELNINVNKCIKGNMSVLVALIPICFFLLVINNNSFSMILSSTSSFSIVNDNFFFIHIKRKCRKNMSTDN